jgi:hypothetical protein
MIISQSSKMKVNYGVAPLTPHLVILAVCLFAFHLVSRCMWHSMFGFFPTISYHLYFPHPLHNRFHIELKWTNFFLYLP